MMNYCLPIASNEKSLVLQKINDNLDSYSYFEIWLDYIEDLDTDFIDYLLSNFEEKLIFLFRRKNLEAIKMNIDQRQKIIWQIAHSKALLDLDLTQKDELVYLKEKNIKLKLIVSYHNYEVTPSEEQLKDITDEMESYDPEIFKISCFCNEDEDSLKLLNLLISLKKDGKKFIVLGMGQKGVIVRIAGALWGNEMNFAPVSKAEASAPGQLTKIELEEVMEKLNGR